MRLTADVLLRAKACLNALRERELDLRGYKIPMIENMGVTQDQFDTIDFSDNEITKIDNFPRMTRLSTLLLSNNLVSRIGSDLGTKLPNLECLILTNNKISVLSELNPLGACSKLSMLCLLENPVTRQQHYRLYVIHHIPSLRILDFKKIKREERNRSERLFKSEAGKTMEKDVAFQAKTFIPGGPLIEPTRVPLTSAQRSKVIQMIQRATTSEEIDKLEKMLEAGIYPSETKSLETVLPVQPQVLPEEPKVLPSQDKLLPMSVSPPVNLPSNITGAENDLENNTKSVAKIVPEVSENDGVQDEDGDAMEVEPSIPTLSAESIKEMKVADLKKELATRGLSTSGLKSALVERLTQSIE